MRHSNTAAITAVFVRCIFPCFRMRGAHGGPLELLTYKPLECDGFICGAHVPLREAIRTVPPFRMVQAPYSQGDSMVSHTHAKQTIGAWYDAQPRAENDVQRAYDVITRINSVWFDRIPVPVIFQEKDPYDSYADMKRTVEREGKLRVFSGGSEPEYMTHKENLKGRAVHDWFGHLQRDCTFSMRGEWLKYRHVKARYPEWVRPLLFTEIVGQRAAASYYHDGFTDEKFEQRSVFAPKDIRHFAERALS